jgi:hypothetical protein
MRKTGLALAVAAVLGAGAAVSTSAQAAPAGLGQLSTAADAISLVEKSQYVHRGRRYCWYDSAWRGSGWYVCGYAWRRGYGWGGPVGWNAWIWNPPGPGVVVVPRGRYYWNGRYYHHRYWRGGRWYYR